MAYLKGLNRNNEHGRSHNTVKVHEDLNQDSSDTLGLYNPAFWYSGGFIIVFVLMAIFAEERLAE